jgi:riboflavin synthase
LVVEMGRIVSVARQDTGARLQVQAEAVASDAQIGDSISINGTCLTVVEIKGKTLSFDVSEETLASTNIGQLSIKEKVNLEPSLGVGSRIGGHFVTGHVDATGKITSKTASGTSSKIVISADRRITDLLVEKGSVAVDGISLTVVDVFKDGFSLVIIPHTGEVTTIGYKGVGDTVNIEVDILGKYVSKFLRKDKDKTFMETLSREGFI